MSVRRAETADAPALAELRWRWRAGERGEVGLDLDRFISRFAQWMGERSGSHRAFLAEGTAGAIGMAWLAVVHRVPGPQHWMRLSGNLQSVYVLPEERGVGVGRLLVDAVIEDARASGVEYLSVHPSERSFSLYERAGFRQSDGVLELRWQSSRRPAQE